MRSRKGGWLKFQVALKNWILLNYCEFFIHLCGFGSERELQHRRHNETQLKMVKKSKKFLAACQTKQFKFK